MRLIRLLLWLPLLGLGLAVAGEAFTIRWPDLLFGVQIGLDSIGRVFLGFSAILWFLAGQYALGYMLHDPRQKRFFLFFILTGLGNLSLPFAQDAASFYLAFATMTFAAYGLVIHYGTDAALRAGRVYLVMAILGEMLLLVGLLRLAHAAGSALMTEMALAAAEDQFACWLLFAGFGVKAGIPLLHLWLPLAHPVAPTPASAVLSGAMIKAGVLGWLGFLPFGVAEIPLLGRGMLIFGASAAFLAVLAGLCQRETKAVLAYSSISQMGYLTVGAGGGTDLSAGLACLACSHPVLCRTSWLGQRGAIPGRGHAASPRCTPSVGAGRLAAASTGAGRSTMDKWCAGQGDAEGIAAGKSGDVAGTGGSRDHSADVPFPLAAFPSGIIPPADSKHDDGMVPVIVAGPDWSSITASLGGRGYLDFHLVSALASSDGNRFFHRCHFLASSSSAWGPIHGQCSSGRPSLPDRVRYQMHVASTVMCDFMV